MQPQASYRSYTLLEKRHILFAMPQDNNRRGRYHEGTFIDLHSRVSLRCPPSFLQPNLETLRSPVIMNRVSIYDSRMEEEGRKRWEGYILQRDRLHISYVKMGLVCVCVCQWTYWWHGGKASDFYKQYQEAYDFVVTKNQQHLSVSSFHQIQFNHTTWLTYVDTCSWNQSTMKLVYIIKATHVRAWYSVPWNGVTLPLSK